MNPWQPKMIHKTEQVIVYFLNIPAIKQFFPLPMRISILSFLHSGLLLFYSGMPSRTPPPAASPRFQQFIRPNHCEFRGTAPAPLHPLPSLCHRSSKPMGRRRPGLASRPFHTPLPPRGRAIGGAPVGGAQRRPGSWPKHPSVQSTIMNHSIVSKGLDRGSESAPKPNPRPQIGPMEFLLKR